MTDGAVDLRRLVELAEASDEAVWLIDVETGDYLHANAAAAALMHEELATLRKGNAFAFAPRVADAVRRRWQVLVDQSPIARQDETIFVRRDGSGAPVRAVRQALRVDGRWLLYVSVTSLADQPVREGAYAELEAVITEREETSRRSLQVQRQREYLAAALNQAADAIFMIDAQTHAYVEVNESAARLFGISREAMLERGAASVIHEVGLSPYDKCASLEEVHAMMTIVYRELIEMQPRVATDLQTLAPPGRSRITMESRRQAVKLDDRWLIIVVGRDVTDRVRAARELETRLEELARSNRDLEQFAYVASHDLSEPLRMIGSYTQLLARRYDDRLDDEGREFMGYVVSGARRMKQLIDDLLVYSRAARGGDLCATPLDAALDEALARLAPAIAETRARIVRAPLPSLPADPPGMAQLFEHLVGNAIKFHGDTPPEVRIRASRQGEQWQFEVADNGIGIDARYHERIFVIFQRLHGFDRYEGNGIGLAVCKKIVERHGGTITVRSKPGAGATFRFTLPAGDAPAST